MVAKRACTQGRAAADVLTAPAASSLSGVRGAAGEGSPTGVGTGRAALYPGAPSDQMHGSLLTEGFVRGSAKPDRPVQGGMGTGRNGSGEHWQQGALGTWGALGTLVPANPQSREPLGEWGLGGDSPDSSPQGPGDGISCVWNEPPRARWGWRGRGCSPAWPRGEGLCGAVGGCVGL